MKRTLAALVALALLPSQARASFVVILGTSQRLVVAADSRLIFRTNEGSPPKWTADSACKIAVDGPLVLTVAGASKGEKIGDWDVRAAWVASRGSGDSVVQRANRLVGALRASSVASPLDVSADVAVAGLERGKPGVALIRLQISRGKLHPDVTDARGGFGTPLVLILGETASTDEMSIARQLKPEMSEREMVALARRLVLEQAKRTPGTVGGPIDVLVVDGKGSRWIDVKPECR